MTAGIVIVLVAVLLLGGMGFFLAGTALGGKRQTLPEARAWQEAHYDLSWYDKTEKMDYTVRGDEGYTLHVQMLKNPEDTGRYVIISHGYTDNRFGAMKYARMYLDRGYSIIAYDLRGHGENDPALCTYTIRERKDLSALIRDSRQRYPDMKVLGLHGESLGAATTVAVMEEKPEVDFAVADCGFAEIIPVLKVGLSGMHLPGFLVNVASLCAKIRCGHSFQEMRPIDSLRENRIPLLFIHGAEDSFIVPEHSRRMRAETKGASELVLIPGAGHAQSVLTDPDLYREKLYAFLDRIGTR